VNVESKLKGADIKLNSV